MSKKTFYGSGRVYSVAYDADTFPKIENTKAPTQEEIETMCAFLKLVMTEDNQIGYLKGGYQFNISTNNLSDKSDLGEMKIDVITEENATCQFSLFNANAETIAAQYPTAQYGTETTTGFGVATIGGLAGIDETPHVIVFKHDDTAYGDTLVICLGKNVSGFDAVWSQDSVTPFACNFAVQPYNSKGNLAMFIDAKVGYKWDE